MQPARSLRLFMTIRVTSRTLQQRTFHAPTRRLHADLVQDLYLKELKNFKPSPVRPSDADAHVRKFALPTAPPIPESEGDIAKDLKTYEQIPVEIEGALGPGEEPVDRLAQYLEEELKFYEQDPQEQH